MTASEQLLFVDVPLQSKVKTSGFPTEELVDSARQIFDPQISEDEESTSMSPLRQTTEPIVGRSNPLFESSSTSSCSFKASLFGII